MKLKKLFNILRENSDRIEWYRRRSGELRCNKKFEGPRDKFCPITMACFLQTGRFYVVNAYSDAAKDIGLNPKMASLVVTVSDSPRSNPTWREKAIHYHLGKFKPPPKDAMAEIEREVT